MSICKWDPKWDSKNKTEKKFISRYKKHIFHKKKDSNIEIHTIHIYIIIEYNYSNLYITKKYWLKQIYSTKKLLSKNNIEQTLHVDLLCYVWE